MTASDTGLEDIVRSHINPTFMALSHVFGMHEEQLASYHVTINSLSPIGFVPRSRLLLDGDHYLFQFDKQELNFYFIGRLVGSYLYQRLHPEFYIITPICEKKENDEFANQLADATIYDNEDELPDEFKEIMKEEKRKHFQPHKCCPECEEFHAKQNLVQFFVHAAGLINGVGSDIYFHHWDIEHEYRIPSDNSFIWRIQHSAATLYMRGWYLGMKAAQLLYDQDALLLRKCVSETASLQFKDACKEIKNRTHVDFLDNKLKF